MKRKKDYNDFLIQIIKFETKTVCRIDKTNRYNKFSNITKEYILISFKSNRQNS